jgi:hypothetical protein
VHRIAVVLAVALPLAAADLVWKYVASTPAWAYHPRGIGWVSLSLLLVAAALAAAPRVSYRVAAASGVMVGGVLGNVVSAAWNDLRVPDPIVVLTQRAVIAFNLADVFTFMGILTLTTVLAVALVHHRDLIDARRAAAHRRISGRRR